MKLKIVIVSMLLLLVTITATPSTSNISVDTSPKVIIKRLSLRSGGELIKGVNETARELNISRFELIYSHLYTKRDMTRLSGSPIINKDNNTVIVNGTMSGTNTINVKNVQTFMQKDSYVTNVTVGEKVHRAHKTADSNKLSFDINREYTIKTYDELLNNDNYTMIVRENVSATAFINYNGYAYATPVNDSDGNVIAHVYGFRFYLMIYVFDSATKELIALHRAVDHGYGNMLPPSVHEYFMKHPIENRIKNKVKETNTTAPEHLQRIDWIPLGHNDTYNLDMYRAFYGFRREATTVMFPRQSDNSLELQADNGLEEFMNSIVQSESMSGFDEDSLENIDSEFISVSLAEDGISIDDPFTNSVLDTVPTSLLSFYSVFTSMILLAFAPIIRNRVKKR